MTVPATASARRRCRQRRPTRPKLTVYAAQRSVDNAVTIIVVNATATAWTSAVSLANVTLQQNARTYQYTSANTGTIVAGPTIAPSGSTLVVTFPANSITTIVQPAGVRARIRAGAKRRARPLEVDVFVAADRADPCPVRVLPVVRARMELAAPPAIDAAGVDLPGLTLASALVPYDVASSSRSPTRTSTVTGWLIEEL